MGERTYYVFGDRYGSPLGSMTIREVTTTTEQRRKLFGGYRSVEITKEERVNRSVPLLIYTEDGISREFFSGELVQFDRTNHLWIDDDRIPEEARQKGTPWSFFLGYGTSRTIRTLNATAFASLAQKWMPYKKEILNRISKYKNDLAEKYMSERSAKEAAQYNAAIREKNSEAWLDQMIKGNKN